jgi:hypothetical protein
MPTSQINVRRYLYIPLDRRGNAADQGSHGGKNSDEGLRLPQTLGSLNEEEGECGELVKLGQLQPAHRDVMLDRK